MIIAEIGLNHLGSEKLLKKYVKFLNNINVDAITVQIIKKDFFSKKKLLNLYINKEKIIKIFLKESKKKVGFIIDEVDENIIKNKSKINFFKILGDQVKNKTLLKNLIKLNKPIFISNRNTDINKKNYIISLVKKNKLINLIHTQNKDELKLQNSNLKHIDEIFKITKKRPAFGLHCNDLDTLYYSIMFKPSDIFFYIKDNNDKLKFPDNSYAVSLRDLNKVVKKIKYIYKSTELWK